MSRAMFVFSFALVLVMFFAIGGTGYWYVQQDKAEKARLIADDQAAKAQAVRNNEIAIASRQRQIADAAEKAKAEQRKEEAAAAERARLRAAQMQAEEETERKRQNRIALFNPVELDLHQAAQWHMTHPLASITEQNCGNRPIDWFARFLISNADIYNPQVAKDKLLQYANDRGAERLVAHQKVVDKEKADWLRIRFAGLLMQDQSIVESMARRPVEQWGVREKEFAKSHPELFPNLAN